VMRARPDAKARELLRAATAKLLLSARAHHRVLKVARTIADLEPSDAVGESHVAEALRYRGAVPGKA
jgi:magnesium chelatase family protein